MTLRFKLQLVMISDDEDVWVDDDVVVLDKRHDRVEHLSLSLDAPGGTAASGTDPACFVPGNPGTLLELTAWAAEAELARPLARAPRAACCPAPGAQPKNSSSPYVSTGVTQHSAARPPRIWKTWQ